MDIDKAFSVGFLVLWVVSAILSLGVVAVVVWAIIRLVAKFA